MNEAFYFSTPDDTLLNATWQSASEQSSHCWVICPPFAEEAKSAHRTLYEMRQALHARGASTLQFSFRGTGDSGGEFSESTLQAWREDILTACEEARRRTGSTPGLIGVRLGASLAAQVVSVAGVSQLILIEPVMAGRTVMLQLGARQKLRSMVTAQESDSSKIPSDTLSVVVQPAFHDYDGWPVSGILRDELHELNLMKSPPLLLPESQVLVLQVGAKAEVAPALQQWAMDVEKHSKACTVSTSAIVMPPFWNRLDLTDSSPLCDAIAGFEFVGNTVPSNVQQSRIDTTNLGERPVVFQNERGEDLFGVWHTPLSTKSTPATTLLMLHGWTGTRSGPHQMLTRAARRFAAEGHAVFRFDFAGRGDSEGDASLATLASMAQDAQAAMRWMAREHGRTRVALIGLCSGCEVALATAAYEPENVEQLVLWSAPVFAAQQSDARRARKRKSLLREYARKLLRPATWAKVISGKVDVRGVQHVLAEGGGQEVKNVESGDPGHLPRGWRKGVLQRFKSTRMPLSMIYGTADPTTAEALDWHRALLSERKLKAEPQVHFVEDANHSYYGLQWEAEVFDVTARWLNEGC